jgi:lipopolysaccharide export system permease protein
VAGIPKLYRYVIREVLVPLTVCLFVFTSLLFLFRSLKLVDLIINKNLPITDTVLLFSYVIPRFLELAIPMSLLLGLILAFGRLSSDSELVVIRACGLSLKQLAKPVIGIGAAACLVTLIIGFWIRPWAEYQLGQGLFEVAKVRASSGLLPGVFNEMGNLIIYGEQIDPETGKLNNVIISDRGASADSRTFIAKTGEISSNPEERRISLRLYDGTIYQGEASNYNVTQFDINDINIDDSELNDATAEKNGKKPADMYIHELISTVRTLGRESNLEKDGLNRLQRSKVELQRRLAIPFSCLCIAVFAMALGIQPNRAGRSWGLSANIGVGILAVVIYYILFAFVSAVVENGDMPQIVIWGPDLLFLIVGVYVFKMIETERWAAVSETIGLGLEKLGAKFSRRVAKQ